MALVKLINKLDPVFDFKIPHAYNNNKNYI